MRDERPQDNTSTQIVKGSWSRFLAASLPIDAPTREPGIHIDRIRPDRIYSFADIQRLTGRAVSTLRRWRKTGRLQVLTQNPTKVNGLSYIRAEQIRWPKEARR